MPSTLRFNGKPIPGAIFTPQIDPPQLASVRDHYPGLKGETEILGMGYAGRAIRYSVMFYDSGFATSSSLLKAYRAFELLIGTNGRLEQSGDVVRVFNDVTFHGPTPLDSPKQDYAGTLVPSRNVWFMPVAFEFYQLAIERDFT